MPEIKPFYMTAEEFFTALQDAWNDRYGDDKYQKWHPEDLAVNISSLAEGVGYFMSSFIKMRKNYQ